MGATSTIDLSKSQLLILQRLKMRGPQSVKILAKQLDMTTMGARQHLTELLHQGYVSQTQEAHQNRGRPVHLWKLTKTGHQHFPDGHGLVTLELIEGIRLGYGEDGLNQIIDQRNSKVEELYRQRLDACPDTLTDRIHCLATLRSEEGYMAEMRLLPDGWLLIEHHCPIVAAAQQCQQFCRSEFTLFQQLFTGTAQIERVDHLLSGARRCAYKITPLATG